MDTSRAASPWEMDDIELTTVGIDVGSSTSHLAFARVYLQRLGDRLSSRYVVVDRRVLFESPIRLTPYRRDDSIDADAVAAFVTEGYAEAGLGRDSVDTGAVILTGEAVKRRNAREISARLATLAGDFVCVTAGPRLESVIAAHGSGSVALSREQPDRRVLNVDIGGGTTKFAVIENGIITATAAIAGGGRLLAVDSDRVVRLEAAAGWYADRAGLRLTLDGPLPADGRERLAAVVAERLVDVVAGRALAAGARRLWVTPPLRLDGPPDLITVSGGVARFLFGLEPSDFGDLGGALADRLRAGLAAEGLVDRLAQPSETIRATVLGASQYTIQLSGNTVLATDPSILPLRNLPVVAPGLTFPLEDADPEVLATTIRTSVERRGLLRDPAPCALAFRWRGTPFHAALYRLAEGIARGLPAAARSRALVLLFDGDVGRSVGEVLRLELDWEGPLVCLDGVLVDDFDFVDVGRRVEAAGAYPVVVKSLVYPSPEAARPSTAADPRVGG